MQWSFYFQLRRRRPRRYLLLSPWRSRSSFFVALHEVVTQRTRPTKRTDGRTDAQTDRQTDGTSVSLPANGTKTKTKTKNRAHQRMRFGFASPFNLRLLLPHHQYNLLLWHRTRQTCFYSCVNLDPAPRNPRNLFALLSLPPCSQSGRNRRYTRQPARPTSFPVSFYISRQSPYLFISISNLAIPQLINI